MTEHAAARGLEARLVAAEARIDRLRQRSEAGGNVVRFRMARHLEALASIAIDASARVTQAVDERSYDKGLLERDIKQLETEVAVAEEKLEAAVAEESGDYRDALVAQIRAIRREADGIRAGVAAVERDLRS